MQKVGKSVVFATMFLMSASVSNANFSPFNARGDTQLQYVKRAPAEEGLVRLSSITQKQSDVDNTKTNKKQEPQETLECRYDKKESALVMPDGTKIFLRTMGIRGKVVDYSCGKYIIFLTTDSFTHATYYGPPVEGEFSTLSRSLLTSFKGRKLTFGRVIDDWTVVGMFTDGRISRYIVDPNDDTGVSGWDVKGFEEEVKKETKPVLEIFDRNTFLVIFPSFKKGVIFRFLEDERLESRFVLSRPFDSKTMVKKTTNCFEIEFGDGTKQTLELPVKISTSESK